MVFVVLFVFYLFILIFFNFVIYGSFCFDLILEKREHKNRMSKEGERIWEGLREGKKHDQNILHERKYLKIPADKEIKPVL